MKVNFTLTQREIDEMKVRCSSATNGPWKSQIEGRDHMGGSSFIMTGDETFTSMGRRRRIRISWRTRAKMFRG